MANNALWLRDWDVLAIDTSAEPVIADARYEPENEACPKCGVIGRLYRHGAKVVNYRDIPVLGKPLVIRAEVKRYRCRECGATSMQELPDMDGQRRMTKRLMAYVEQQGITQTFSAVARHVGLDEKTVRQICEAHIRRVIEEHQITAPLILGIDELTIGGRKRTVFVDVGGKRLLDMIDAMNRSRVDRWLYMLPDRDRVRIVTIDMWGPYRESATALLPNSIVVIDKWHVVSKANYYLDRVRARFRQGAKGKDKKNPRRGRIIMHIKPEKLSPMKRMMLDAMLDNNPLLKAGWECKEAFYAVWKATDRTTAERLYDEWKTSIPKEVEREFTQLARTVDNWRTEIFAYFDHPFTNAYTEARNRLVKDLSRAGRGYSFDKIRAKALLSAPLTSKPLILCESCLGRFPTEIMLDWHTDPTTGKRQRICPNCHRRFHTAEGLLHGVNSTAKSE